MRTFEVTSGTIMGREHSKVGKNNQDGLAVVDNGESLIGVICDGCGSSPHSEVGAKIAAKIIATSLSRVPFPQTALISAQKAIHELLPRMGPSIRDDGKSSSRQTVSDYFLFTCVGFFIDADSYFTFICGDGVIQVNEDISVFTSGENNTPDYLGYTVGQNDLATPKFQISYEGATVDLRNILIGCDGVIDIIKHEKRKAPGVKDEIGPISQFWTSDRFFKNPATVQHRLNLMSRSVSIHDEAGLVSVEHGVLIDDTTIIAARRKADASCS
jgi:hypothetical protein